ncbi:MAG: hypothetical protein ACRDQA_04890, partial [Nocardioidaceae bacterium]
TMGVVMAHTPAAATVATVGKAVFLQTGLPEDGAQLRRAALQFAARPSSSSSKVTERPIERVVAAPQASMYNGATVSAER